MNFKNLKLLSLYLVLLTISIGYVGRNTIKAETGMLNSHLKGCIWDDTNLDGNYGINESGLNNIKISLLSSDSGELITTTITDIDGKFFLSAAPGNYKLEFEKIDNYLIIHSSSIFSKIIDYQIKDINFVQQLSEDQALVVNVPYIKDTNEKYLFNKKFDEDFNKKFDEDFNTAFNAKFNADFNKFYNLGYHSNLK